MTAADGRAHCPNYEVAVAGTLGPVIRAWFADLGLSQTPRSTVFRMELADGSGPADISAMLRAKGLVLLSARRLSSRPSPTGPATDTGSDRSPHNRQEDV